MPEAAPEVGPQHPRQPRLAPSPNPPTAFLAACRPASRGHGSYITKPLRGRMRATEQHAQPQRSNQERNSALWRWRVTVRVG